jgi:hypothetical protein
MRLLHTLAVRCALDPEARMHVCTALHVHNNFRTLYERLHACFTLDDFVELFECVQHAYGTRVFRDVTCNHVPNLVCVMTMYRVWVFHVDADHDICTDHNVMLRGVNVHIVDAISVVCGALSISCPSAGMADSMLQCMQALQVAPTTLALEEQLLYPAIRRAMLQFDEGMPSTPAGAREELIQVGTPFSLSLHPHTFNSSPFHAGTPNPFAALVPYVHTCVVFTGGSSV